MKQSVSFLSGERVINGTIHVPRRPVDSALLLTHGFGTTSEALDTHATAVRRKLGMTSLSYDLSGLGRSTGNSQTATIADHHRDVQAAYDFLQEQSGASRIYALGTSYGAYLTALLGKSRSLAGMVLHAPVFYPDSVMTAPIEPVPPRNQQQFRYYAKETANSLALDGVRRHAGRVMIVESSRDPLVFCSVIDRYVAANGGEPPESLDEAGHVLDHASQRDFQKLVIAGLSKLELTAGIPAPRDELVPEPSDGGLLYQSLSKAGGY